jgi:hypothetical protein
VEEVADEADKEAVEAEEDVEATINPQQTRGNLIHPQDINSNNIRHRKIQTSATKMKTTATLTAPISRAATTVATAPSRDTTINTPPPETMQWADHRKDPTRSSCLVAISSRSVWDVLHLVRHKTMAVVTTIDGEGA